MCLMMRHLFREHSAVIVTLSHCVTVRNGSKTTLLMNCVLFGLQQCSSSPTQQCLEPTPPLFSSEQVRKFLFLRNSRLLCKCVCSPLQEGMEHVMTASRPCFY